MANCAGIRGGLSLLVVTETCCLPEIKPPDLTTFYPPGMKFPRKSTGPSGGYGS
jgi:hypothetical protein